MQRSPRRSRVAPTRRLAACARAAFTAALLLPVGSVAAQDVPLAPPAPAPLRQPADLKVHFTIFAAGAATIATVGAFQSRLAPSSCRWCDLHDDGTDALNGLDRQVRELLLWQHPDTASAVSDALAFGVVPAVTLGAGAWAAHAEGHGDEIKIDMLVVGEAVVLAANTAEFLKIATARLRPHAHARALGEPVNVTPASSDVLSFASGHVAFAVAMTVSAAEVATLRGRRRAAGWIWGLGLPAAAAVGYCRIAGDRHYLTDVMASAGIGAAIGLIVPRAVFKVRPPGAKPGARVTVAPLVSGSLVGMSLAW